MTYPRGGAASLIITRFTEDARQRARGTHHPEGSWQLPMGVEGRGSAPLGWEAWDYEQGQGYSHTTYAFGRTEPQAIVMDLEDSIDPHAWSWEEVGLCPLDLTDEMEDWDVAPVRYARRRGYWDWEPDPAPMPRLKREVETEDDYARSWTRSKKMAAREQREADERRDRNSAINEERRNITAMKQAANAAVLARLEAGDEGRFEVQVRKGNQTLTWKYEIRDGRAFIDHKSTSWLRADDPRRR